MQKIIPRNCPSCNTILRVKRMECPNCNTSIEGAFDLPMLALLPADDQKFIISFVKYSGSLKDMAKEMNLSYPTVRNLLDEIIGRIKENEKPKLNIEL